MKAVRLEASSQEMSVVVTGGLCKQVIGMRSTSEKISIFKRLFSGFAEAYGTYDPASGKVWQVKQPVTDKVFLAHLKGRQPYGVYLLVKDRTRAIAADFDAMDRLPPFEFVSAANHYGIQAHIERSKSKGYHVWVFFEDQGVAARKARGVARHILEEIEHPEVEVFPKQDVLNDNSRYGNFINAPLFGALVPEKKTVFVESATFVPYPDQWDLLDSVERCTESVLDDIIEINTIDLGDGTDSSMATGRQGCDFGGLPSCALNMLKRGVSRYQRVSCFRLAVHFKRIGLPYDIALAGLSAWAQKNTPQDGKKLLRRSEIAAQTLYAYKKDYRGCGCESEAVAPFCDPDCHLAKNAGISGGAADLPKGHAKKDVKWKNI